MVIQSIISYTVNGSINSYPFTIFQITNIRVKSDWPIVCRIAPFVYNNACILYSLILYEFLSILI